MPDALEDLLARLREDPRLCEGAEETTRQGSVLPILARLGWDPENTREVSPEFSVGGGRIDYCLRIADQNAVFIEVKRYEANLDQHQEQLLKYAFQEGVNMAVLTDGLLWWLYLPLSKGSWDQRRFFAIDIQQQEVLKASQHFREFLGRQAVESGSAVERARKLQADKELKRIVEATIPKAWNALCEEPDELLVEMLAEKVASICGRPPKAELLTGFLERRTIPAESPSGMQTTQSSPMPVISRSRRQKGTSASVAREWTGKKASAYSFNGHRYEVNNVTALFRHLCHTLYKNHNTDFDRVLKLCYFKRDKGSLKRGEPIGNSGIYVNTCLSNEAKHTACQKILEVFGYSLNDLEVEFK